MAAFCILPIDLTSAEWAIVNPILTAVPMGRPKPGRPLMGSGECSGTVGTGRAHDKG